MFQNFKKHGQKSKIMHFFLLKILEFLRPTLGDQTLIEMGQCISNKSK